MSRVALALALAVLTLPLFAQLPWEADAATSPPAGQGYFVELAAERGLTLGRAFTVVQSAPRLYKGFAGEPEHYPELLVAFNLLVDTPDAADRFESMIKHASPAGVAYALCGLYLVDQEAFARHADWYAENTRTVPVDDAGEIALVELADLIRLDSPRTIQLSHPRQTLYEWYQQNVTLAVDGYVADIRGGGYPALLRVGPDGGSPGDGTP